MQPVDGVGSCSVEGAGVVNGSGERAGKMRQGSCLKISHEFLWKIISFRATLPRAPRTHRYTLGGAFSYVFRTLSATEVMNPVVPDSPENANGGPASSASAPVAPSASPAQQAAFRNGKEPSDASGSDAPALSASAAVLLADVMEGMARAPKSLPCKYLYDAAGSRLFDRITELSAYYPTATERAIMQAHLDEMVACLGPRCLLLEYGSGSSLKTRLLLDQMSDPAGYVAIDISEEHLAASMRRLRAAYPHIPMRALAADYTTSFAVPSAGFEAARAVVYFPGSTIGNFEPREALDFLTRMAGAAGPGGGLLIGVDLEKDRPTVEAAYNDAEGVTAAFNKNLLRRLNRELGATFDLDAFRHRAVYNLDEGRIEMSLVSACRQTVRVNGHSVRFAEGEPILVEYSYKFTLARFRRLAERAGFAVQKVWTDANRLFSVQYLRVR